METLLFTGVFEFHERWEFQRSLFLSIREAMFTIASLSGSTSNESSRYELWHK